MMQLEGINFHIHGLSRCPPAAVALMPMFHVVYVLNLEFLSGKWEAHIAVVGGRLNLFAGATDTTLAISGFRESSWP